MKIATVFLGCHDSNFCIYNSSENKIKYFTAERLQNCKHATMAYSKIFHNYLKEDVDILIFSDNGYNFGLKLEKNELFREIHDTFLNNKVKRVFQVDHHYAHALSACFNKNISNGVAIDSGGDNGICTSVFTNLTDLDRVKRIFTEKKFNIGHLFKYIPSYLKIGSGSDGCGKLMGLQSYGNASVLQIPNYDYDENEKLLFNLLRIYNNKELISGLNYDNVATAYKYVCSLIYDIFDKNFKPGDEIAYGGGCALSTVTNTELDKKYKISICPAANDSGISIGLLKFADLMFNLKINFNSIINFTYDMPTKLSEKNIELAAKALADNKIIAIAEGSSEIGPRALGKRSILMNPSITNGKDLINSVKHREWWRPFGGTVISTEMIEGYSPSNLDKFMLKNFTIKEECRDKYNSICHIDNTSRLQVLNYEDANSSIYRIIKRFKELTGLSGVLNTSFNIAGKPIPSSINDCAISFSSMDIDYLFMGSDLIHNLT